MTEQKERPKAVPAPTEPPHTSRTPALAPLLALLLALLAAAPAAHAIPAFARRTGLRCSACHEAWPKLSNFGETFKDNGYQIGNERDSPVYTSPFYAPIAFRITPFWHTELNSAQAVDQSSTGVQPVRTQGFDLAGLDLWTAGLLNKNISFVILPSSDEYGNFHFESAWVRFDNIAGSRWLNLKAGKFELDDVISEKRILTLSNAGGYYQSYHFLPYVDPAQFALAPLAAGETGVSATAFGLGDNQLGLELMGHSRDNYTRYAASLLSSSDGDVNLPYGHSYDGFFSASRAFNAGTFGMQRFGAFTYLGQTPTRFLTQTAPGGTPTPIAGSGYGTKGFTHTSVYALFTVKQFHLTPMFTHATESAYVALGIPANDALPKGVQSPTWNGRMLEVNYIPNLSFAFTARYEDIRNTRQIFAASRSTLGDLDAETVSFRWYPFTTSRDGLAVHTEFAKVHSIGISPIANNQTVRSGLVGIDFAF